MLLALGAYAQENERADQRPYEVLRAEIPGMDIQQFGIVYRTPGLQQPVPGLLILHGWAVAGSIGAALVADFAFQFQQRVGYTVMALSLRGWPHTGGADDCALRQPRDVLAAIQWFAQQPGVDAQRIALLGHSQGGQVALLAAALGAPIRAVVSYAAPVDIDVWAQTTAVPGIISYVQDVCQQGPGTRVRSPIEMAGQISQPVLLVHGVKDERVPASQSFLLYEALKLVGGDVHMHLVAEAGHALAEIAELDITLRFLTQQLLHD